MWFIGLLGGAILGSAANLGEGTIWGAMIGALVGAVIGFFRKQARENALEARVSALEKTVAYLSNNAQARAPVAASAPPASAGIPPEASEAVASQEAIAPPLTASERPAFDVTPPAPIQVQRAAPAAIHEEPSAPLRDPAPPGPGEPNIVESAWAWLTGGNALVRIGVIVLFFGIAFLLKYAYDHTHLPIELRLVAVSIGAIAMLVIGWRLRDSKPVYALAMQGGGVGLLYLTVFGAFRIFSLIPGEVAFALLAAIAAFSATMAVLQNAMSLAVLGASGGFLAPILASTGGGSHVALFSYYALLNAGLLGIAFFKAWRPLNVLGFVFTFGIGAIWGARFYRPEFFESTEPFLALFVLEYLAITVLFAFRQAPRLRHYVDSTIVFGTPLVGFGLQAQLVKDTEYGAAWGAVAFSALYLILATLLYRRHKDTLRMLVEAFLALGVIFATLAIPLAFGGRWTSAAWALEGAAAYWVGVRQGRRLPRASGLLLQLAAGIAFLADFSRASDETPVLNTFFLGCALIAGAGLFSNRTIERNFEKVGHFAMQVSIVAFAWGLAWWLFGGLHEIDRFVPQEAKLHATLLFLASTCGAFGFLRARGWVIAGYPALALAPLILAIFVASATAHPDLHPLAAIGWLAWPVALAAHFFVLERDDREGDYRTFAHAAGTWLLAGLGGWEIGWQIAQLVEGARVWHLIAWAVVPGALLAWLAMKGPAVTWPVLRHLRAYLWFGAGPIAVFMLGWTLYANFASDGDPAPLPYLPILNPLDLAQLLAFAAIALWWRAVRAQEIADVADWPRAFPRVLIGAALFVFLNGVLLRTLHHWAGIPYQLDIMLGSGLVQSAFSIFWTVLALVAMVTATRTRLRVLWACGAGLMGVVVVKLFLVDLAHLGGVERIVSFIGVGVLMLVIGYFSPLPPKEAEQP